MTCFWMISKWWIANDQDQITNNTLIFGNLINNFVGWMDGQQF